MIPVLFFSWGVIVAIGHLFQVSFIFSHLQEENGRDEHHQATYTHAQGKQTPLPPKFAQNVIFEVLLDLGLTVGELPMDFSKG